MSNIVKALLSIRGVTKTRPIYRYDYGMVLKPVGIKLPDAYEVHFSNYEFTNKAKRWIGDENGCIIPDEYLESGDVWAFIFLHTGENDGETEFKIHIPVIARPKAEDTAPTPVQQDVITQTIAALNVAVSKAESAVEHYPKIEDNYWCVWDADEGEYVNTGIKAEGEDGTSATVTVSTITGGHRVIITDADGDHTFDVLDGTNGIDGTSPEIYVTDITGGHRISIIDVNGTQTVDIMDGTNGEDGFSPTITVSNITGGHRLTITDVNGTRTVDVMDGTGSSITVDDELSPTSTNPVQNKVINGALSAINEDLSQLETGLEEVYTGTEIHVPGINRLNPNEILADKGLRSTTGEIITQTGYSVTGYISLDTDKTSIAFTGLNYAHTQRVCLPVSVLAFYNSEKVFISGIGNISSNTITAIPTGVAYARLAIDSSYISDRQGMVEFVDAIGDISTVFVEYSDIDITTHGINYLNETVDTLVPQVAENTENIEAILGTEKTIDNLTTFARGSAGSSGAYETYYQYRVATPDIYTLTQDITITIADGFRVYLNYFSNGTRTSGGWTPSGTFIPSGSQIRMMIARVTEDTSEIADVELFCSKVLYGAKGGLEILNEQVGILNMLNGRTDGMTWDWWITSHSVDDFGTAYIGYVDTDGYAGIIRRQPDGITQYKRLEKLYDDDDHNAPATIVLDDGRVLVIGSYGHTVNNHIVCWRSKAAYSIDDMEQLSFDITGSGYTYKTCYSQVFKYNGVLFDFLRFGSIPTGGSSTFGYACLISTNNGTTWTAYKVFNGTDAYNAMAQCTDDSKYIKVIVGANPAGGTNTFVGCYIDLSTYKIYDLSGTQIGAMVALNGGSIVDSSCAKKADMTSIITQTTSTQKGRLFFTAETELADTVFLYAIATDSTDADFVYKVYNNGTVTELGHSGTPFGNGHYISGACFGVDENTVYYSKAITEKADGAHELHKVKITNNAVSSDDIVTEAGVCVLRPLFLGNGELATVVGHYNDQNSNGTYNGSFTAWELKPLFTHA